MTPKVTLRFEAEEENFSSWDLMSLYFKVEDEVLVIKDQEGISARTITLPLVNIGEFKMTVERSWQLTKNKEQNMIPDLETMISDIVRQLERPHTLEIWFDPDSQSYGVGVWDDVWHHPNLEKCVSMVWAYVDQHRKGDLNV